MDPQCKYLLMGGAAAGGKSYWLRWAAIGLGMYYFAKYGIRNVPIGLFSEDYPTLKDRQVIRMKNEIPPALGKLAESRDEGYAFIGAPEYGDFRILLRNLDDPSKYASAEFAAIGVEEITKNPKSTIDDLRFRLRYPGILDPKFFAATNPGGIGHGIVKKLWVKPDMSDADVEQDRFFYIPAKYSDNKFIDETYVRQLESLPEDKRRAFMDGDWDVFAGQYFGEWRDALHVCNPFIPSKNNVIVGGMDWGRANPFAFYLAEVSRVQYSGRSFNRVKCFMEVYGTEKSPVEWWPIIKEKMEIYHVKSKDIAWVQADPAMFNKGQDNSISISDQFKKADDTFGFSLKPASNDRIAGWANYHDFLRLAPDGLPYFQVSSDCPNLIRTLPELIHDELKVEDVDSASEDHGPDATRYLLKKVKFIDGGIGGINVKGNPVRYRQTTAQFLGTGQVPIDVDLFSNPKGSDSEVGGVTH